MLVHILQKSGADLLCGTYIVNTNCSVLSSDGTEWLFATPSCEACILLYWTDPDNTYRTSYSLQDLV